MKVILTPKEKQVPAEPRKMNAGWTAACDAESAELSQDYSLDMRESFP